MASIDQERYKKENESYVEQINEFRAKEAQE